MNPAKPPFDPDALYQRALSLHHMGQLDEAEVLYRRLLSFFPNQPEVLATLGTLSAQQGRHEEGIRQFEQSLKISPRQPIALYNLGAELQKLSRLEEALACYDKAIALHSTDVDMHLNRGNTLKDLGRHDEALASYDRAIALQPACAAAYWNKGLINIFTGNFEPGWQLYEWGWNCGERGTPRNFPRPRWLGEQPIDGKTLLIHAEQGLGDAIQFCRYAPMVAALAARVVLEVPAPLVALLSTLEGDILVVQNGSALPDFDLYCPVMSLPLAFKTTISTIPAGIPYLHADPAKQRFWQERLGRKTRPRVGLAWSGSATHKNDHHRSIPLHMLEPLLQLPLEFHSLMKEIRPGDAPDASRLDQIHFHRELLHDFSDTAALASEMDLVISVDTSVAHLAGALGKPVWVLLPFAPDYRWMANRSDTPWYPGATLFRQPAIGDWCGVIDEAAQQLKAKFLFAGDEK
ncbi:beta-barrel assembly-enhancing protease [mine drainage metagenome]|uniref:Beta-barrel assembly-enhancing protease n=1 Tax=mine drainage metagenome TaxID=410659 RepID=A0A1J5QST9_9ZZZZ